MVEIIKFLNKFQKVVVCRTPLLSFHLMVHQQPGESKNLDKSKEEVLPKFCFKKYLSFKVGNFKGIKTFSLFRAVDIETSETVLQN